MTDVTTSEVERLLPCPFCGSSASEFPVDAVNCDNRDCDASVYVVGRETWQRRAAIQQDKDRAGEALPPIETIQARLWQEPDAEFTAWRDATPDKHWARLDLSALRIGYELGKARRPAQPAEVSDAMVERAMEALMDDVYIESYPSHETMRAALTAALRLPDEQAGGAS